MKMTNPRMFLQVDQLFEEHNRMHVKLFAEQIGAAAQSLPAKDPAGSEKPKGQGNVVEMGRRF
jgi:hypothetical protein